MRKKHYKACCQDNRKLPHPGCDLNGLLHKLFNKPKHLIPGHPPKPKAHPFGRTMRTGTGVPAGSSFASW